MRYVHFYVANKSGLQEGAIISTTWLAKACTLYEPQSKEPFTRKMDKSIEPNQHIQKETSIPSTQPPLAPYQNFQQQSVAYSSFIFFSSKE